MMRKKTSNRFSFNIVASVMLLASVSFSGHAQSIGYDELNAQEKADLARYLGWVWGDGRPGTDGSGILYKGANSQYAPLVERLTEIRIGGVNNPFGFPESGDRKYTRVWNYWENSLPGGNSGDPQILRDAIRHPNFLAGILEGEGQIFHTDPNRDFYIADQSYAPSHPDKIYDIANFGPERMVQLFSLVHETYGFNNPAMSLGGVKYNYNTDFCVVTQRLRDLYNTRKAQNEQGDLRSGFGVKVYVKPPYLSEIARYGYYEKSSGKYRTPAPDNLLRIISGPESEQNSEVTGGLSFFANSGNAGMQFLHSTGDYLNSDLDGVTNVSGEKTSWQLIDLNNGYYRIESLNSLISKVWLQAANNGVVKLASTNNGWHWTQWEKLPVANASGRYYFKNRYHGTFLRVAPSDGSVGHGVFGSAAQWEIAENNTQCG